MSTTQETLSNNPWLESCVGKAAVKRDDVTEYTITSGQEGEEGLRLTFFTPALGIVFAKNLPSHEEAQDLVRTLFGQSILYHTQSRDVSSAQPSLPLDKYDA